MVKIFIKVYQLVITKVYMFVAPRYDRIMAPKMPEDLIAYNLMRSMEPVVEIT